MSDVAAQDEAEAAMAVLVTRLWGWAVGSEAETFARACERIVPFSRSVISVRSASTMMSTCDDMRRSEASTC
eukprot:3315217-Pleurochrysis_carterae.AAC.2